MTACHSIGRLPCDVASHVLSVAFPVRNPKNSGSHRLGTGTSRGSYFLHKSQMQTINGSQPQFTVGCLQRGHCFNAFNDSVMRNL